MVWQTPALLQVRRLRMLPLLHVGAPQLAPTVSRRHEPSPLQPLRQASLGQRPPGSTLPTGTSEQVPTWPVTVHDWQRLVQLVLQQTPCAHWPDWHCVPAVQAAPSGRPLVHAPLLQTLPSVQC